MPKLNPDRPRGPETDVAIRIALEREKRGWSAAELARRVSAANCPLNQSAINKIEQGDPPRRITVDELVAFAQVFGLELGEMLVPAHAALDQQVARAYERLAQCQSQVWLLAGAGLDLVNEIAGLIEVDAAAGTRAKQALDSFRSAFRELTDSLDAVDKDVKARVRGGGLPDSAEGTAAAATKRAAQAASPARPPGRPPQRQALKQAQDVSR